MAKAGRGETRRDSKRRVLRPGESVEQMENISINIILMENHILYTVGNWKPTDKLPKGKKNMSFSQGVRKAGKHRFRFACEYRRRTDDSL